MYNSSSRFQWIRPFIFLFFIATASSAQYSIWTLRGGPTLSYQRWNGAGSTQPLLGYHGAVGVESYEPGHPFVFFGELGYFLRGSSRRIQAGQTNSGINYDGYTLRNKFHNVALALGGRKHFGSNLQYYYLLALRGEYTVAFELEQIYNAFERDVRKFNYGLDVGGGMNFPLGAFHMGFVQLQLKPDLSRQIQTPPIVGYDYQGTPYQFPEQRVVNLSIELSVGIRFNGNLAIEE